MANRLVILLMLLSTQIIGQSNQDSSDVVLSDEIKDVEISASVTQNAQVISLSRKQFLSMAGALEDPTRLLIKFPGISTVNDQANSVVYRGMPAQFHRWSLYGARILNPNHLGNAGTISDFPSRSAGGVNMLSGQVIGNLDFNSNTSGTSFDALSASSDIKLREPYKNGVSTNLSLIGMEAGLDRVSKDGASSFLLNYRYSTVGLLTSLGLDFGGEVINYQDLTGKYSRKFSGNKSLSVYFSGGLNSNMKEPIPLGEQPEEYKDLQEIDFESTNFVAGIVYENIEAKSRASTTVNFSYNETSRYALIPSSSVLRVTNSDYESDEFLISAKQNFSFNFGKWQIGTTLEPYFHSITLVKKYPDKDQEILNTQLLERDALHGILTGNFNYKHSNKWTVGGRLGFQYVNSNISNTAMVGQFQVDYTSNEFSSSLSLSRASQMYQPEILIYEIEPDYAISENMEYRINYKGIGISAFLHKLSNIPISLANYGFSGLDNLDILPLEYDNAPVIISPNGSADIYGASLSYTKSLAGIQLISNLTLTNSKHFIANGESTKAPLDYGHVFNLSVSKNWNIGNKRQWGISASFHQRGGARQNFVNEASSFDWGYTNFNFENQFSRQLAAYQRMDLRIIYKPSKRSTISLDIQNVLNRENDAFYYFEPYFGETSLQKQLGMIPILGWRVNW